VGARTRRAEALRRRAPRVSEVTFERICSSSSCGCVHVCLRLRSYVLHLHWRRSKWKGRGAMGGGEVCGRGGKRKSRRGSCMTHTCGATAYWTCWVGAPPYWYCCCIGCSFVKAPCAAYCAGTYWVCSAGAYPICGWHKKNIEKRKMRFRDDVMLRTLKAGSSVAEKWWPDTLGLQTLFRYMRRGQTYWESREGRAGGGKCTHESKQWIRKTRLAHDRSRSFRFSIPPDKRISRVCTEGSKRNAIKLIDACVLPPFPDWHSAVPIRVHCTPAPSHTHTHTLSFLNQNIYNSSHQGCSPWCACNRTHHILNRMPGPHWKDTANVKGFVGHITAKSEMRRCVVCYRAHTHAAVATHRESVRWW